ncbi:MAG: flagellar biosynthetic protein FliR, partial [Phycisphaerales bacterium]
MPEPLADHAITWLLVVFRLTGLFVFTPVLSGQTAPRGARALMAVAFGAAVYPALPGTVPVPPRLDLISLGPLIGGELFIGVAIGALASIPVYCMQLAGMLMGYQMGLAMARSYDPTLEADSDVISRLMFYVAMCVFVALGGLESVFLALLASFESVPIGGMSAWESPVAIGTQLLTAGFVVAIRVAAPVLCIIFLQMISMGFVMKTMPQINILSVGFAIKIMIGLGVIALALKAVDSVAGVEIEQALGHIEQWVTSPGMA